MDIRNSQLEPDDLMYLVTDDEAEIPRFGSACKTVPNTEFTSDEDESPCVCPWDTEANMKTDIMNTTAPTCNDIFMDDESLMDKDNAPRRKKCKSAESKLCKTGRKRQKRNREKKEHCAACEKSRKYLEYLTALLENIQRKQSRGGGDGGPKKCVRRKKRRCRKSENFVPRCAACPPPCGDMDTHDHCVEEVEPVPKNMGWNWIKSSQERRGWKPGAIPKTIREIMGHFLKPCPCDTLPTTKHVNVIRRQPPPSDSEAIKVEQRPMIQLQRENDELTITMRPLKNSQALKIEPDPYLPCEPIRVKISGIKEVQQLNQVRKVLEEKKFTKCCCGRSVAECKCRDNREMEAVRKCLNDLEHRFGIKDLHKKKLFGKPNDNLQLDFTPPAGIVKPGIEEQVQIDMQAAETQYDEQDYREEKPGKGGAKNLDDDASKGKNKSKDTGLVKEGKDGKNGKGSKTRKEPWLDEEEEGDEGPHNRYLKNGSNDGKFSEEGEEINDRKSKSNSSKLGKRSKKGANSTVTVTCCKPDGYPCYLPYVRCKPCNPCYPCYPYCYNLCTSKGLCYNPCSSSSCLPASCCIPSSYCAPYCSAG